VYDAVGSVRVGAISKWHLPDCVQQQPIDSWAHLVCLLLRLFFFLSFSSSSCCFLLCCFLHSDLHFLFSS
jgi:hypothetical protein